MEYPEIPTENLYKFLALAGLALLVFSVSYPIGKVIDLEVQEVDANAHRRKIEIETAELERQVGYLEKKADVTAEETQAIRKKLTDTKLALVDIDSEKTKTGIQRRWINYYTVASIAGTITGFVLSVVGFLLWYFRVQKPSDRLTEKGGNG